MKKLALVFVLVGAAIVTPAQTIFGFDNVSSTPTNLFAGLLGANGGAAADPTNAANTITRLQASRITVAPGFNSTAGLAISAFSFSLGNVDTVAVSARPRIRFYGDSAGAPGALLGGLTFNPISFGAGSVTVFSASIAPILIPTTFWVGVTFDNNAGATGATAANLNNLGIGLYRQPAHIGTAGDATFQTTLNGSFFAANPVGTLANYVDANNAPLVGGWAFQVVPEPASMGLLAVGLVGLAARRRRASK